MHRVPSPAVLTTDVSVPTCTVPGAVPRHLALLVPKVPLTGQAKPTGVGAGLKLLQKDLQGK